MLNEFLRFGLVLVLVFLSVFLLMCGRGTILVRTVLEGLLWLIVEMRGRYKSYYLFERVVWVPPDEEVHESEDATE